MRTFVTIMAAVCLLALPAVVRAQDLTTIADSFYAGLADVIERNMDNPEVCVQDVESYYRANQSAVAQMRQAAQKAMEQVAPEIEKYMNMTEEDLQALAKKHAESGQAANQPHMSVGAQRYTRALKNFSAQYPQYGMKIATKAMQLAPGFTKE